MKVSRRDLFLGGVGLTTGLLFTPVPWKLLGDVSIWTQSWPWIPQPARGPVETKQSACTLCAAGCGLRVRMAGGWPVGISGMCTDPRTKGALCPLAFAAHQLNWHPRRLRGIRHNGAPASWAQAQAAFAKACTEGPVAIVDGRPGRAISSVLQEFAAKHNGCYRVVFPPETQALLPYAAWSGVSASALGYDLENTATILSFGAPLLDGWGTPGRFTRLWSEKAAGSADPRLRLIQVEPTLSRTAARAWRWIAIRESTETALAAGLAQVLLEEDLVRTSAPKPPQMSLSDAAAQTGLSADAIRGLARTLVERRPAVAIAPGLNPAIAALNVLLGTVGAPGGIVVRGKSHQTLAPLESNATRYRAVLLDATVPWEFAPQTHTEVFRFAAWDGGGSEADWLLPAPGFLEELTDLPAAPTSGRETYAVAVNLVPQHAQAKSPAQFLAAIDATSPDVDKLIQARCEQIYRAKEGAIFTDKATPVGQFDSAARLEEQLRKGAVWVGDPPRASTWKCNLTECPTETHLTPTMDWTSAWTVPVFPPLAGKLYQESNLRKAPSGRQA